MKARTLAVLLGLIALLLVLFRPGGGAERIEVGVTKELFGRWTAVGPRHSDRFLEIRSNELSFGHGLEGAVSHRLLHVFLEATPEGPPFYVLVYEAEEVSADAPLELRVQVKGERLLIANLNDVWWKRST
jgi:hypothetical protein